ncbi:DUF2486 family protein [Burkholderia sp. L27(2015)]|uniref:DUF2486 family protein n=1 Tax=Burkholderia sp. L27(2015) TaxID=1641858 RepID=UPI00131C9F1F|nr:DUF2486 family protein [Burkholderia sp. L27(2015)]
MFKRAEPLLRWGSAARANAASAKPAAAQAVPVLTEVLATGDPAKARAGVQGVLGQTAGGSGFNPTSNTASSVGPAAPFSSAYASPGPREPAMPLQAPELTMDSAGDFAERMRGQLNDYLRKDGRGLIELRCRSMLETHTAQMVEQISAEVTLMLEIQIRQWIYESVVEALERQNGATGSGK